VQTTAAQLPIEVRDSITSVPINSFLLCVDIVSLVADFLEGDSDIDAFHVGFSTSILYIGSVQHSRDLDLVCGRCRNPRRWHNCADLSSPLCCSGSQRLCSRSSISIRVGSNMFELLCQVMVIYPVDLRPRLVLFLWDQHQFGLNAILANKSAAKNEALYSVLQAFGFMF